MSNVWYYVGVRGHMFSYDHSTAWITCTCGTLNTKVSSQQAIPVSERHVRIRTRHQGSLVRKDLS